MRDPQTRGWWPAVEPLVAVLGMLLTVGAQVAAAARGVHLRRRIEKTAATCGRGLRINGPGRITGLRELSVGENVHVGVGFDWRCEAGCTIGDNTHISRRLTLYTINHEYQGVRLPYDDTTRDRPVVIGRNVWIGIDVTILPGTRIGDGAIIGAGSIVAGDIPPLQIVGGPLATAVGARDEAHYRRLDDAGAYGGVNGRPLGEAPR